MRSAVLLLVLTALPVRADPLDDLKKKHDDAQQAYFEALKKLPGTPAGREAAERLWEAFDREQGTHFDAAVRLAMADPKSDAALLC